MGPLEIFVHPELMGEAGDDDPSGAEEEETEEVEEEAGAGRAGELAARVEGLTLYDKDGDVEMGL